MEHRGDGDTIVIDALCTVTQGLVKRLEDLEMGGRVEAI